LLATYRNQTLSPYRRSMLNQNIPEVAFLEPVHYKVN
jgi:hypothetical protein